MKLTSRLADRCFVVPVNNDLTAFSQFKLPFMSVAFRCLTIHVPNVWQTCEWYRQVFSFLSIGLIDNARAFRSFAANPSPVPPY